METVKPYTESGSKKEQVAQMFNNIAKNYDFLNHFLSVGIDRWWRKKMIQELAKSSPKLLLDVATGTADVAINAQKALQIPQIIGVDISTEMLAVGRKKIEAEGLSAIIELKEGDSENLPFQENIFDAVSVAYGVRNFENLEQGLSEIYRVLKPEGKLVVLEFSKPTAFPLKQLFNFYFKNILPLIGKLTSKDDKAYNYLYESVQAFPNGQDFLKVMTKTGFKNTQCSTLTFGICSLYIGSKS